MWVERIRLRVLNWRLRRAENLYQQTEGFGDDDTSLLTGGMHHVHNGPYFDRARKCIEVIEKNQDRLPPRQECESR